MVYISSWHDFQDAAEKLYTKSPVKTRYVIKWRAAEGKLVLKITDDTECIKFKTQSSIFLNRFEALNLSLMEKMQNKRAAPIVLETARAPEAARASTPQPAAVQSVPAAASGGVKKKKPKKKK
ncbi:signal recognition particle, SRP9/SRP14 subunit [Cylindrobasidium torrendii FP15055 ss-10]|uniref:Signal recognition particle, SRP9/SRP14 subunit n=1 Tax=Cylindrobasidium torrendii FP15055 ss-10 TaxID=1314674 RepID=A0A0D7BF93_9AGAR|nr:signal recognition particle, SRP9/SRP14 subunit [Cylindrobasidium torrendii FP15055 ss-10]